MRRQNTFFPISKRKKNRGDIPVGQILIIGVVVIPLVIFLIRYQEEIQMFLIDKQVEVYTENEDSKNTEFSTGF
jgi:hypothetical protein